MNGNILRILLKKEVTQIRRSFLMRYVIFAMPMLVMLVIPLVATLDVKNVDVVVVDNDRTPLSRRIVADMDASGYLSVTGCYFSYGEAFRRVEEGEVDVIVTIPGNYLRDLVKGTKPRLDVKANGVNATKGTLGARYVATSMANTLFRWQAEQGIVLSLPKTSVVNLYNQALDFRDYMIPALMVVLLIVICGFLPTLNLVSEKETGTIELLGGRSFGRHHRNAHRLVGLWSCAKRECCEYLFGDYLVQSRHVGPGRIHCQQVGHYPAKHICDVCFHRHIPAYGRPVHPHRFHARMGTMRHLRHTAPLFY